MYNKDSSLELYSVRNSPGEVSAVAFSEVLSVERTEEGIWIKIAVFKDPCPITVTFWKPWGRRVQPWSVTTSAENANRGWDKISPDLKCKLIRQASAIGRSHEERAPRQLRLF